MQYTIDQSNKSRHLICRRVGKISFFSKMDWSQETLENLNKHYELQLAAVDEEPITEDRKCYKKNDILRQWIESLQKRNKTCIQTIVSSSQILESATADSYDGPTTIKTPSCVDDKITCLRAVVKQMGLRSKQALSEMKNFVVSFEHQFQINKTLMEEKEELKYQVERMKQKISKFYERSSKIEEENAMLKRIIPSQNDIDSVAGVEEPARMDLFKLKQENKELKEKFKDLPRNLEACQGALSSKESHRSTLKIQPREPDMTKKLAALKSELNAKDQQITSLTQTLRKFEAQSATQSSAKLPTHKISSGVTKDPISDPGNNLNKHANECDSDESNLTDAELLDKKKIRTLQKGARTMAALIKEKYDQLRDQRDEIACLHLQLDNCHKLRDSKAGSVFRSENENCSNCEQLRQRLASISKENKLQMEIYSRKLYLQEGQITTLMFESQQLIYKHGKLMKCINLCHQELSRYIASN